MRLGRFIVATLTISAACRWMRGDDSSNASELAAFNTRVFGTRLGVIDVAGSQLRLEARRTQGTIEEWSREFCMVEFDGVRLAGWLGRLRGSIEQPGVKLTAAPGGILLEVRPLFVAQLLSTQLIAAFPFSQIQSWIDSLRASPFSAKSGLGGGDLR
jgi:hypothetical protein